jgi:hypothetical protein
VAVSMPVNHVTVRRLPKVFSFLLAFCILLGIRDNEQRLGISFAIGFLDG